LISSSGFAEQGLKRRKWWLLLLLLVMEWWRWEETKVGFWIRVFHGLQTQIQVRIDLIGRRRRIWVTMSAGKDSNIVACFQREIRVSESDF
jgi:hypothetical protein